MDMELNEQIAEAIKAKLPQAVGEQLRARLEQAEADAAAVKMLTTRVDGQREEIQAMSARMERQDIALRQHGDLAARETALAERERNQEIFELKASLAATNDKVGFMRDVTMGLVRNTEFREKIMSGGSMGVAIPGAGGMAGYVAPAPTSSTSDVTREAK